MRALGPLSGPTAHGGTGLMIQRFSEDEDPASAGPITEESTTPASGWGAATTATSPAATAQAAQGLIVEDSTEEVEPGRVRKSEILMRLRSGVESALSDTLWSSMASTWIAQWSGHYAARDAATLERDLHRQAPETARARSADEYVPLVVARVRGGASTWASTAGVPGMEGGLASGIMGAVGGLASGIGSLMFMETPSGGARTDASPRAVQAQLGAGRSLDGGVTSRMGSALGQDFSHVRVHTDTRAGSLNRDLNSRAFTVGQHVAFGPGEYKPGTPAGDALIAHELAHVTQQTGPRSAAAPMHDGTERGTLEEEADQSAVGAVSSIWGKAKGGIGEIARNALPRFKSGLRLQRCGKSTEEKNAAVMKLGELMAEFEKNEKEIITTIDDLGGDAGNVLLRVYPFSSKSSDSMLYTMAGVEAGQRIMTRAVTALRDEGVAGRFRADEVEKILKEKTAAKGPVSPDDQKNLDRINTALNADSRMAEYKKAATPLRFPVEMYSYNMEMNGGVYYDKSMPKDPTKGGEAGATQAASWGGGSSGKRATYPLIYIRLGPLALTHSDEYIRSVMWHEFQHYKQYLLFREPDAMKSPETKLLEKEITSGGPYDHPNAEIEATSIQIVSDFDVLSDDELISTLRYLADHMGHAKLDPGFKTAAIDRIKTSLATDRAKQDRMLGLIKKTPKGDRTNLADLTAAINASLVPKKKTKGAK